MDDVKDRIKLVPAICPQCGGTLEVDPGQDTAVCQFCGSQVIIEKAINNYNVQNAHIDHADHVSIDMSGTVKSVLDFAGEQLHESREFRKEIEKERANESSGIGKKDIKILAGLFGVLFAALIIILILNAVLGAFGIELFSFDDDGVYFEEGVYAAYQNGRISDYYVFDSSQRGHTQSADGIGGVPFSCEQEDERIIFHMGGVEDTTIMNVSTDTSGNLVGTFEGSNKSYTFVYLEEEDEDTFDASDYIN